MRGQAWTPEQQAALARLASEHNSAQQIADALGRTRNAVIGRACRSGVALLGPVEPCKRSGGKPKGFRSAPDSVVRRPRPWGASAYTLEERAAAVAARLAGASYNTAAALVGASAGTLHRTWQHDPEVRGAALDILQRAKQLAWRERRARRELIDRKRAEVAAHNADVLAGLDNRTATIAHRRLAGEPLSAIARDFGFTRQRAHQLFMRAVQAGLREPPGVSFLRARSADAARAAS